MRLCRSTLLLVTCVTYLGFVPTTAFTGDSLATLRAASNSSYLDVAQASPLQAIQTKTNIAAASSTTPECSNVLLPNQPAVLWWSLVLIGVLGATGGLLYLLRFGKAEKTGNPDQSDKFYQTSKTATGQPPTDLLAVEKPSRLAKINIVEELIKELRSPDRTKRQKAIWDLGQQGDSRSVQPLVELMLDSDSQQRSLILAALAEIGTRTLQPMNRALAISLQDESAEVRKNAIRDLTRTYELMVQISQLLCHAVEDPDAEVQETARWALSQMNRIRAGKSQDLPGGEPPR